MTTTHNLEKPGFVSLVGAGPGDPGLITWRGIERLAEAEVVVYDRLANPLLLRIAPQAERIPVGKESDRHTMPQEKINALLIEKAREGRRVVRLKGGDPFIFGRGGEEALALAEAGIPFEVVPGVGSAIAAPAYAGIPITHRDVACSAALITGHRAGWVDHPEEDWQQCSLGADTLVFLMGVKNLVQIVEKLIEAGRSPETPVALVERGSSAAQKTVIGTLATIVERAGDIRPPAVIIVGEVVRLREQLRWYDSYDQRPLFGIRVLNTRAIADAEVGSPSQSLVGAGLPMDEFDRGIFALGGEAIHMPVIQISAPGDLTPLQAALRRLAGRDFYEWVVFSSANVVKMVFEQLASLGYDARALNGVRVAAVGKATRQMLQRHGILPDFVPSQFSGADLGKELPLRPGGRILLPRSEVALADLPKVLLARGAQVDEVPAYTVQTAAPDPVVIDLLLAGELDVAAFFSPSGLTGLAELLAKVGYDAPLKEILAPLAVACIGPSTAKAAADLGVRVDVVAQEYTSTGLVEALVAWRKHS